MPDITVTISGMSCRHCLASVRDAVAGIAGVDLVSLRIGQADLRVLDDSTVARVKAAIEEAGYSIAGVTGG